MPNHFHTVVINNGMSNVGVDPCVNPKNEINDTNTGQTHGSAPTVPTGEHGNKEGERGNILGERRYIGGEHGNKEGERGNILGEHGNIEGEHVGSPLHRIVQWFKTMSTNEYIRGVKTMNWKPFNGKLWQRNYYEHIIRNEQSYQIISDYIINNPAKWAEDKFYRE